MSSMLVCLDFDGTLAELHPDPYAVRIHPGAERGVGDLEPAQLDVIEAVAQQVFIPLTVGGGIRSVDDIRRLLNVGADKVSVNTAAIHNPQLVADAARYDVFRLAEAAFSGQPGAVMRMLAGLRAEGEALHKAGDHSESVKVLGEALDLLSASE